MSFKSFFKNLIEKINISAFVTKVQKWILSILDKKIKNLKKKEQDK